MFNLTSILATQAQENPEKTALIHPSHSSSYTWDELYKKIFSVSIWLRNSGITKDDRVILFLYSSPEYLISCFALWRIGAVVVPANIVYRKKELEYVVADSEASAIITGANESGVISLIAEKTGVMCLNYAEIHGPDTWDSSKTSSPLKEPVPRHPDDLCQIQYTSGTTGKPKGAMLTVGGWAAALDAEREALDLTSNDVYLGIYPMSHVGISWGISVLKQGGTWVIMERYDLEQYLELVRKYRVTILSAMPPVIHSIMETPPGTEDNLKTVRRIISGGGPMHAPTWRAFHHRFGIPIINAYGLSETIVLGAGTAIRPGHYPKADEFNSVGKPVGYTEVKIVDLENSSRELTTGEEGEIALRGPGVALGYWGKPEDTAAVFLPDGWFLTGDIGYIDNEGMLVITDRKKDMIIMSGWKIYPTEVENALIQHPAINDIAVFGCPDKEKGEIPVAAVIPKPGMSITHEELVAYGQDHLAGYKIPRRTILVETLPRAGGWKLLRRQLRDEYCP